MFGVGLSGSPMAGLCAGPPCTGRGCSTSLASWPPKSKLADGVCSVFFSFFFLFSSLSFSLFFSCSFSFFFSLFLLSHFFLLFCFCFCPPKPPALDPPPLDPPKISLVLSLNFGVFEGWDPEMCTFGLSGCRVFPQRLRGRRLHTARELQTCTFDGPAASNTTIPRKDHQEREERMKTVAGEGKKERNFGPFPTLQAPHPSGPPGFGAPLFQGLGLLHPSGPHPLWSKNSTSKNWPKSKLAEVDRARTGPPYAGPPKISLLFFLSHLHFRSFCVSRGVFSLNFGFVFGGWEPRMCKFGVLWLLCETPAAALGPPGHHTTARELQT